MNEQIMPFHQCVSVIFYLTQSTKMAACTTILATV